ncbi:glycosyltransferase family 4 protein [Chloroflexus aggregans]|uniref:Glycosyl transferase family 4 n=1 Tax=Chloroflexus aggregans (strain MD-66 / DSM 9485) TaxID=326427 RepID=B8GCK9_CHLAD|nr:MraY family glycosyltransferase [Chloroflexus aggregans]ACL25053.1 glycosyl transferase family 4 [Chloroflexus aggregans DSM 9485]
MPVMLALIGVPLIAFVVTALLTPPLITLARREGWVAKPGPRHVHREPTPVVGGLAMIAGLVVALIASLGFELLTPVLHRSPFEHLRIGLLLIGIAIIAGVSLLDDLYDLPALPRLGVHIIAALVAVGPYLWDHTLYPDALGQPTEARGIILTAFNFPFVYQIHLHNLSPWLAIAATVFWIVGMQNMVNWLDGLDGLAAGVTLIAGVVLALHTLTLEPPQMTVALLPLALSGVCAAFLLYNSHPARIFMGDVGAMTIGYTLGICALIGGAKLATVLLVLGVPLVDMAWLILTRTLRGRSAAQAGRDHLHHRFLDLGLSQRQVVACYYGLSIAFGAIGLLDFFTPLMKLIALVLLGLVVLVILIVLQPKPTTHAARL